ncbi:MAG: tetratricopeptide repeat protein [Alphaproteobacteria bacterium]|nr:tetratricopeptide repeat protein [Alphaproteobacteria bacterium]
MNTIEDKLQRAGEHFRAGQMTAATGICLDVLRTEPEHGAALDQLGLIQLHAGRAAEAAELFQRAVAADSESPAYHDHLARSLRMLGRNDEADAATVCASRLHTRRRLVQYQRDIEVQRRSRYLDFPQHVHLETMATCNAACVFCPYPNLERQGERMPDELIEKILSDLGDMPKDLPFHLSPFKVNEPFLDVRLFDILGLVNERLPQATITLTSNATPITAGNLDRIERVKNIGYLWISFNDHRADHYERTMKLPYQRTIERLDLIHKRKAEGRLPFVVVLSRVGDGTGDDQAFRDWCQARYPLFGTSVFQCGGWLGQVDTEVGDVPDVGCMRWFELSITATGAVAHCCMDGQAKWPIGDVRQTHVLDIYNSPDYRRLRAATTTRHDAEPCKSCTFL